MSNNAHSVDVIRKCATCKHAAWDGDKCWGECCYPVNRLPTAYARRDIIRRKLGPFDPDTGTNCPCWQAKGER